MSKAKKAPIKKKTNGYKMPEPLPKGEILQDIFKKQWVLGPSIGKGGFGEIYSAKSNDSKSNDYPYVIKIEPHENGPLFVEMHFYARNAKEADIKEFKESKKLKTLGMPAYIGSGSHMYKDEKYRFIVMEKFASKDIWKLFIANNKKLPPITVYKLGLQMLDVLEYIHSKGYVHADIKGANILLSEKNANQAYLVDFGLAGKFTTDKEFKPNPKKMHDGTIEYLSRDAHQGVPTRRGDCEILAYNLIHWLCGKLPWEVNLTDPKIVQASKEKHMKELDKFLTFCFSTDAPGPIRELLKYVNKMKFDDAPDYPKLRKLLVQGLKENGGTEASPLSFKSPTKRKSTSVVETETSDVETTPMKRTRKTPTKRMTKKKTQDKEDENDVKTDDTNTKENKQKAKATPAKRTRRVNTVATVEEVKNGDDDDPADVFVPVMNKEMLRIKEMAEKKKLLNGNAAKKVTRPRVKKTAVKLNKSLSDIVDLDIEDDDDQEEVMPVSRRAMFKRAVKGAN